jgi:hypothetical protein
VDAAAISVLGTLAGAGLGLAGASAISRAERREDRRVELKRAYARFLAATYSAVAELRELPPDSEGSKLASIIEQFRGEDATYVQTRKTLAAMGNTHITRMDRLNAAIAEIQVLGMPPKVVVVVNETGEYVQRLSDERSDEVKAEWPEIFERLQEGTLALDGPSGLWWHLKRR